MTAESLKEAIKRELPLLLREDPAFRDYVLELTRQHHPSRGETEDWFHTMMGELRRDREEQTRKWEAQERKWEAQEHKWEESNRHFERVHEEIMAQAKKLDRSIGGLGARWGMQSETAFRKALAGILEESFGVQVLNVNEYDDEGKVFGCPEQIELDIIIKNGLLLICELKSSIDKAGMYSFERKARFYEARHQRKAQRLIVISPMIDPRARKVAEQLGIEVYHDSLDVPSE